MLEARDSIEKVKRTKNTSATSSIEQKRRRDCLFEDQGGAFLSRLPLSVSCKHAKLAAQEFWCITHNEWNGLHARQTWRSHVGGGAPLWLNKSLRKFDSNSVLRQNLLWMNGEEFPCYFMIETPTNVHQQEMELINKLQAWIIVKPSMYNVCRLFPFFCSHFFVRLFPYFWHESYENQ